MTQIITCLTADYIIHAVDMKLSDAQSDWAKEKTLKTVCFKCSSVISFTGAALLGAKTRTDKWMVDVLRESSDLDNAIDNLRTRTSDYIRANPTNNKRLAFVAASFIDKAAHLAVPTLHIVSNFHNLGCIPLPKAKTNFDVQQCTMDMSRNIEFHWVGATFSKRNKDILWRNIKQSIEKSPHPAKKPHYLSIASNLLNAIRRTSHEDTSVGQDVVITVMPNRSIPALRDKSTEFLYYPSDKTDPEEFLPHMILGNGSSIRDVKITHGISDEMLEVIRKHREESGNG